MKTPTFQRRQAGAFTLLEVIIVLAITALLLSAVYTVAQGTLTLADNVRRAQSRDTRQQAFTTFCEHLFTELPATAALNLTTQENDGQYLAVLEFENVNSPYDGKTNCHVTLATFALAGGGLRMDLICQSTDNAHAETRAALFDDLLQCEWRVFDPATRQWMNNWKEPFNPAAPVAHKHPSLVTFTIHHAGEPPQHHTFWIAPAEIPTAAH
jgi:prepilin-type N-terminal cleavage/methylation domain-containing protein